MKKHLDTTIHANLQASSTPVVFCGIKGRLFP